jgi:putative addiction module component (TIGR02574 family)
MTTIAIRKKLMNYMKVADDKKVKAIYALFEDEIEEGEMEYTTELKKELDSRFADYKNGKAKMFTATESKKRVRQVLKLAGSK